MVSQLSPYDLLTNFEEELWYDASETPWTKAHLTDCLDAYGFTEVIKRFGIAAFPPSKRDLATALYEALSPKATEPLTAAEIEAKVMLNSLGKSLPTRQKTLLDALCAHPDVSDLTHYETLLLGALVESRAATHHLQSTLNRVREVADNEAYELAYDLRADIIGALN